MDRTMDRERLIRNLVLLRRVGQRHASDELAVVQDDLEGLVGRSVSRSVASRLLGVSPTALDKWVSAGEIPVVMTPTGRREVPLAELVDLLEEVDRRRLLGEDRYPLSTVLRDRRVRARKALAGALTGVSHAPGHRRAELRSLAFHRAVAHRLDEHLLSETRARLQRWLREGKIDERWAQAWSDLLSRPTQEIAEAISRDDEESAELRQSSPFAGSLNHQEREHVLELLGTPA